MTRRGLVALGDSITNGRGEPALGVPMQSWAQWLAEALELPFSKLALDGARAADVRRELVPRLSGPYEVGCLYAGINDARSLDWDAAGFERDDGGAEIAGDPADDRARGGRLGRGPRAPEVRRERAERQPVGGRARRGRDGA